MDELASQAIWTNSTFLELLAELGFVHRRNVNLLPQLFISMSEGTIVAILAGSSGHKGAAKLCLLLDLVILG